MKKFTSCAAVGCVVFLIAGYLFVNWANQPENVKAVLDQREKEAAQKIEDQHHGKRLPLGHWPAWEARKAVSGAWNRVRPLLLRFEPGPARLLSR